MPPLGRETEARRPTPHFTIIGRRAGGLWIRSRGGGGMALPEAGLVGCAGDRVNGERAGTRTRGISAPAGWPPALKRRLAQSRRLERGGGSWLKIQSQ